jgi:hypothetical protein
LIFIGKVCRNREKAFCQQLRLLQWIASHEARAKSSKKSTQRGVPILIRWLTPTSFSTVNTQAAVARLIFVPVVEPSSAPCTNGSRSTISIHCQGPTQIQNVGLLARFFQDNSSLMVFNARNRVATMEATNTAVVRPARSLRILPTSMSKIAIPFSRRESQRVCQIASQLLPKN